MHLSSSNILSGKSCVMVSSIFCLYFQTCFLMCSPVGGGGVVS